jgi:electron transfer flavoprotein alpha/beta subunit
MKIIVCVKQARSLGDEVGFTADGRAVDPAYLNSALNEWDAYATEEALRLREAQGGEVVVVTVGDEGSDPAVRRCLAMGADRGVRTWSDGLRGADPIAVAVVLADVVRDEAPDLVFCGVQSSDDANGAVGSALAALLDLPCETCVVGLELDGGGTARVRRELEGGLVEVREVPVPAVITVQTGINEPRYATFRAIKQADQKELAVREVAVPAAHARVVRMGEPVRERHAEMIGGKAPQVAERIAAILKERLS